MSLVNTSATPTQGEQTQIKVKEPKRILHFSDGTLEEYSSDEAEADQVDNTPQVQEIPSDWIPWLWYSTTNVGYKTLEVCDSIGEYLADFFGITSSKYYAEIEHYKESLAKQEIEGSLQNVDTNNRDQLSVNF